VSEPTRSRKERLPVSEPPTYEQSDIYAIKALWEGKANEGQQKMAVAWLMNACGVARDPFRPADARLTDYLMGRQSVGRMVLELVNAKVLSHG
tara:strand:+ start:4918 stop:5196 length:279 start_codon:yes stop_codon:yes gene_type:complete